MNDSNIQVNLNLPGNLNDFLIESAKNNEQSLVDEVLSRVAISFEREMNLNVQHRLEIWLRQQGHINTNELVIPHTVKEMIEILMEKYGYSIRVISNRTNIGLSTLYRFLKGGNVSKKAFVQLFNLYCVCFYESKKM